MKVPQDSGPVLEPASLHTCQSNAAPAARLDFGDESCFDEAQRGFVGSSPDARIAAADLYRLLHDQAADAMEPLAYQSESATWRNAYALGAKALRVGAPKPPPAAATGIVTPKVVAMLGTLAVFNPMFNILEP